jgi:hypothetical protein
MVFLQYNNSPENSIALQNLRPVLKAIGQKTPH